VRHLIYHITPHADALKRRCWLWHLRQLQHYAPIFDGQRIFAVATGAGLVAPDVVAQFLPPRSQIIAFSNSELLRETFSLPLLLARAYTVAPSDAVFYAHTKGMTWPGTPAEATTRWWSLAMYRWLLSPAGMNLLHTFPVVGWRKHEGSVLQPPLGFPEFSTWHYAGTFWWFNAAALYAKPWWCVEPTRFGAEVFLSRFFPTAEAACHHSFGAGERLDADGDDAIYKPALWRTLGIPTGSDAESYDGSPAAAAPAVM
jgi:hypothetical protein